MNSVMEWLLNGSGVAVPIAAAAWLWPRRDPKERKKKERVESVTTEKTHTRTETPERVMPIRIPQPQPSPTKPPRQKKQRLVDIPMQDDVRMEVLRVINTMNNEPENWHGPPMQRHWCYRSGAYEQRLEVQEQGLWIATGPTAAANGMMVLSPGEQILMKAALKTLERQRCLIEREEQRKNLEDTLNLLENTP